MRRLFRILIYLCVFFASTPIGFAAHVPTQIAETVDQKIVSSSGPFLCHIQDLHEQISAQTNLAEIILRLNERALARGRELLVAVEGAQGRVDIEALKNSADPKAREAVAVGLLKSGYLFGEEYAALTNADGSISLAGIEDMKLYRQNIAVRDTSQKERSAVLADLNLLEDDLARLIDHTVNKQIADILKLKMAFQSGRVSLKEFLFVLRKFDAQGSLKTETEIPKFFALQNLETTMDYEKIDRERERLLKEIRARKNPNEWARIVKSAIDFRDGHLSPLEFYSRAISLSNKSYPRIERYMEYLKTEETLSSDTLLRETEQVSDKWLQANLRHPLALSLYRYIDWVSREKNYFSLQLSPEEWSQEKLRDFALYSAELNQARTFVSNQFNELGIDSVNNWVDENTYAKTFQLTRDFYSLAEKRGEVLAANMKSLMVSNRDHYDFVIVAGGFHTPELINSMKQSKLAYSVLRPQSDTQVVLPQGNQYPPYVDLNAEESSQMQFVRPQGGAFAEGGLEFIRRLFANPTDVISERMWPKKLGSAHVPSGPSLRISFDWVWRWVSAAIPGLRILEGADTLDRTTYANRAVENMMAHLSTTPNTLPNKISELLRDSTPLSDTVFLFVDIDTFGWENFSTQSRDWFRLLQALNDKLPFSPTQKAHVIFYSKHDSLELRRSLKGYQKYFQSITWDIVINESGAPWEHLPLTLKPLFSLSDNIPRYRLAKTGSATTTGVIPSVSLGGIPHLALATFAFANYHDAESVLRNLAHLLESLTSLKMEGSLTQELTTLLLARLSA